MTEFENEADFDEIPGRVEREIGIAQELILGAESLNSRGMVDTADTLWQEAISICPAIYSSFGHVGFKDRGNRLRTLYQLSSLMGLEPAEVHPLTEKEHAEVSKTIFLNPDLTPEEALDQLAKYLKEEY